MPGVERYGDGGSARPHVGPVHELSQVGYAKPAQGPYGGRCARHGYQGLVTGSANVQLAHLPGALATVALLRTVTPLRTSDFFFVRGAQSRRVRLSCGCNSAQQAGVGPILALTEQVDALSKYVSG